MSPEQQAIEVFEYLERQTLSDKVLSNIFTRNEDMLEKFFDIAMADKDAPGSSIELSHTLSGYSRDGDGGYYKSCLILHVGNIRDKNPKKIISILVYKYPLSANETNPWVKEFHEIGDLKLDTAGLANYMNLFTNHEKAHQALLQIIHQKFPFDTAVIEETSKAVA